jgi:prepilin-type N-terminal cleavage/methylation domain-containing protein
MEDTMRERGFTLVEVLIAVFIGGILLFVAANWFMTQTQAYKYLNAQGLFRVALHLARERAMMERTSIPLASVKKGGANTVVFAVGVDPDTYASSATKPSPPYYSGLENGRPYRLLLQAIMPAEPTSSDGKTAMSNSDFWSLNDRVCEVTTVTSGTAADGSDEITCRCSSTAKSSKLVDMASLSLTAWPLPLAQCAKARAAVVVNIIPATPGTVLDTVHGDTLSSGDFAVLKDRGTILDYYVNTQRLRRSVVSPIAIPPSDTATSYAIVFNQMGGTQDASVYIVNLAWISTSGTQLGGARFRILPSGDVR